MSSPLVVLRTTPLSVDEVIAAVAGPGAGAVSVFLGTVRNHNDGRVVVKLEYQAYEAMALAEMKRIVAELGAEIADVTLAVRALIDRIKERVPIWKREHGPDGAYWVGWQDARCTPGGHGGPGHETAHLDGASETRDT
jgi:molybdopterin synthase catalytic subunit